MENKDLNYELTESYIILLSLQMFPSVLNRMAQNVMDLLFVLMKSLVLLLAAT